LGKEEVQVTKVACTIPNLGWKIQRRNKNTMEKVEVDSWIFLRGDERGYDGLWWLIFCYTCEMEGCKSFECTQREDVLWMKSKNM
jgi:hypothetical protein